VPLSTTPHHVHPFQAIRGEFALVYVTPEKMSNWEGGLKRMHDTCGIAAIAVDEAHCVSEWGRSYACLVTHLLNEMGTSYRVPQRAVV
jgi:superfamily II DNA helicase RecQ